jgi:hypothetical protein
MPLERFVALEKRTDGKFLNASPSAEDGILKNILGEFQGFEGFNVSRSLRNLETLPL